MISNLLAAQHLGEKDNTNSRNDDTTYSCSSAYVCRHSVIVCENKIDSASSGDHVCDDNHHGCADKWPVCKNISHLDTAQAAEHVPDPLAALPAITPCPVPTWLETPPVPKKPPPPVVGPTRRDFHRNRAVRLLTGPFDLVLDGSVQFTHTREWLVPARTGVYLIHDLRGVLYVGRTADLRRRFTEHYWICGNQLLRLAMRSPVGVLLFSWQQHLDQVSCGVTERRLVSRFQPVCNRLLLDLTSP